MKRYCLLLILSLTSTLAVAAEDSSDLAIVIRGVLPKQGWSVNVNGNELLISGPKVKTLFRISLPAIPETKLWSHYANTERVEVKIVLQARILEKDLAELRQLRDRLASIVEKGNQEINHRGKDGDLHIREFGYIRLPDYRSDTISVFASDNIAAGSGWPISVNSSEVTETVKKIYRVLEGRFVKVDQAFPEGDALFPDPTKTTVATPAEAGVAPASSISVR